jgi:hypothetical protein
MNKRDLQDLYAWILTRLTDQEKRRIVEARRSNILRMTKYDYAIDLEARLTKLMEILHISPDPQEGIV